MRSKHFLTIILLVTLTLFLSSCDKFNRPSQNASKAIEALQAIKYKIEVGTSFIEYGKMLTDASVPVKTFLDSPEAKSHPELSARIEDIWSHYLFALGVWQIKIEDSMFFEGNLSSLNLKFPLVKIKTDGVNKYELGSLIQKAWGATGAKLDELKKLNGGQ